MRSIQLCKKCQTLFAFHLQAQVDSTQFVNIFCKHVLPHWNEITTPEGSDPKLELLKIFAEVSEHCGELENPEEKIDSVYKLLLVSNITFT